MQIGHFSFHFLLSSGLFFPSIKNTQNLKKQKQNLTFSCLEKKITSLIFVSRLNMMIHLSYGMCNRTIFHFDKI